MKMLIFDSYIDGIQTMLCTLKSPERGLSNDTKITLIGQELNVIGLIAICSFLI